jgi:hypothetical protein
MSVVRALLAKKGRGFLPADEDGERLHSRMEPGECALFKVVVPRSLPWHNKYFGICRNIGKNQDPPRVEGSIDFELRIRAGHFEPCELNGEMWKFPKRINFEDLTADEWAELWPSLELAIRERFGDEYLWEDRW